MVPEHRCQGIFREKPSEYDRLYYPAVEDTRNTSAEKNVDKIRHYIFNQIALETFFVTWEYNYTKNDGFGFFLRVLLEKVH